MTRLWGSSCTILCFCKVNSPDHKCCIQSGSIVLIKATSFFPFMNLRWYTFFLLQNIWIHFSVPQLRKRTSQRTFATLTTQRAAGQESPPSSSSLTGSERICLGVRHLLSTKLPLVDIGEAGKCVFLHTAYISCII